MIAVQVLAPAVIAFVLIFAIWGAPSRYRAYRFARREGLNIPQARQYTKEYADRFGSR